MLKGWFGRGSCSSPVWVVPSAKLNLAWVVHTRPVRALGALLGCLGSSS
jgi:hypothetical protein